MGLVLGRNYEWCLVIVVIFMRFGQEEVKSVGMLKSHQSHKSGTLFIGKAGLHCVIMIYCETLLQVLVGIYCT